MTDILIRDVPPDVLALIDGEAERQGLSRTAYLRRQIAQDAGRTAQRGDHSDAVGDRVLGSFRIGAPGRGGPAAPGPVAGAASDPGGGCGPADSAHRADDVGQHHE